MEEKKYTAIVLAAGQGKRMGSSVHKQYMLLCQKPVLCYALEVFEKSPVDEVILVVGKGEIDYCKKEIVDRFGFQKVKRIVEGGAERYHSVFRGLGAAQGADYVLIHDGARPFVDEEMIERSIEAVKEYDACVVGMPVKDTIKIADDAGFSRETPNRENVWMIQTPQTFSYSLICQSYEMLLKIEEGAVEPDQKETWLNAEKVRRVSRLWDQIRVTDDAMVVELLTDVPVKLIHGSYENIKITTPEDLVSAEIFAKNKKI